MGCQVIDINDSAKNSSLLKVDRAYEDLKRLIVTMELAPGAHIDERELMATFDIGRTPLREAVLRLVHERLVVHTPRRGAWVSPLSVTDLKQMTECRLTLEAPIARMATERITQDDIDRLSAILDEGQAAIDADNNEDLVNLDFQLHLYIAQCSGNDYLASFLEQVNSAMLRYWHLSSRNSHTLPTWRDNHAELVHAIISGDPDQAEEQARRHVFNLRELLRGLLL